MQALRIHDIHLLEICTAECGDRDRNVLAGFLLAAGGDEDFLQP